MNLQESIRRILREELDDLQWIKDIEPNKWDYFKALIKDIPRINIKLNENGEWVNFSDDNAIKYFDEEFFIDYELLEDIKSNPLPDFLNAVSQHIELSFQGYEFSSDEDYWDFRKLEETLKKANETV